MKSLRAARTAFSLLLLLAPFCIAQQPTATPPQAVMADSDQRAILAVLTTQQSAWNRGDIPAFLEGYWRSPELTFSGTDGIARGWDDVLARYKKAYADRSEMGTLDFSHLEFRSLGSDSALVLGHWRLARSKGDIGGVFTLVWQRFPEGWRIVHDHTSAETK
jgi:beta-aspartyl-peptidase (threonine type)